MDVLWGNCNRHRRMLTALTSRVDQDKTHPRVHLAGTGPVLSNTHILSTGAGVSSATQAHTAGICLNS